MLREENIPRVSRDLRRMYAPCFFNLGGRVSVPRCAVVAAADVDPGAVGVFGMFVCDAAPVGLGEVCKTLAVRSTQRNARDNGVQRLSNVTVR
jgi:hypothetical protein